VGEKDTFLKKSFRPSSVTGSSTSGSTLSLSPAESSAAPPGSFSKDSSPFVLSWSLEDEEEKEEESAIGEPARKVLVVEEGFISLSIW
jgi:hypothetical protein